MTFWHWPTSFGYIVIDDECDEKENRDALIGWREKEFKNPYGNYTVPKLYCYFCRGFGCSHIQSIND